jgi:hypothetical protein
MRSVYRFDASPRSAQRVVAGSAADEVVVITVYEPAPLVWDAGFKRRRR